MTFTIAHVAQAVVVAEAVVVVVFVFILGRRSK